MRYRYRIEPTPAQQRMLARVFGCCRVVFNDALRVRDEAYRAGVKLSDSEIQRRVITAAKNDRRAGWLAEVPSVALVQSVNDSRRAWRNFFDSPHGKRRGRKVGRPRMKSKKDHRQSFRLTRNGFSVRPNGRLFVAKVGEVRVRWSRELPSEPSSVTIIREPDGHYYASFVVDVPADTAAGGRAGSRGGCGHHPVGDDRHHRRDAHGHREPEAFGPQAAQAAAVGAGEVPPAERIEQQRQDAAQSRHRAQRGGAGAAGLSPQAGFGVGSRQPSDPRRRPQHRGHGRNRRLARAISDAGWGQFVRIIGEKAERYGRTLHSVSRWLASSKTCSACGHRLDELPLQIRQWTCPACRTVHDRDHNAAKIILAAGRAERLNASHERGRDRASGPGGAPVSPPPLRQARAMKQEAPQPRRKPPRESSDF